MTKKSVIITTSILIGIVAIFTILFGAVFRVGEINIKYTTANYPGNSYVLYGMLLHSEKKHVLLLGLFVQSHKQLHSGKF